MVMDVDTAVSLLSEYSGFSAELSIDFRYRSVLAVYIRIQISELGSYFLGVRDAQSLL